MIRQLVVSFPPGNGGLDPEEVSQLLEVMTDEKMAQGGLGHLKGAGTKSLDTRIRSGRVQWIMRDEIGLPIYSHLFTLASVANRERQWNLDIEGIAHALQGVRYAAEGEEHYDWHMDWGGGKMKFRKITLVAHLAEEGSFEGGSLQVTNGSYPVAAIQKAGTVTVFPSFLMHRVTPVTAGLRSAVVAWVLGPSLR